MATTDSNIDVTIFTLLDACGSGKTICPSEVARAIAGKNEKVWRLLMQPIRIRAIALCHEGRLEIKRKGKVVDPDAFKGVYRISYPL